MEFTIRSREEGSTLALSWDGEEHWIALLTGPAVTARTHMYIDPPVGETSFLSLFADMAENWRGWEGEKTWESLEGEMQLRCTTDLLGHVTLRVDLRIGWTAAWRASGELVVEAGQLDALVREVSAFLEARPRSSA